jgi:hypothetical protein
MLCVERVSARCADGEGLWRGQLAWAITRPDRVCTIVKILAINPDPDNIRKVSSDLAD